MMHGQGHGGVRTSGDTNQTSKDTVQSHGQVRLATNNPEMVPAVRPPMAAAMLVVVTT